MRCGENSALPSIPSSLRSITDPWVSPRAGEIKLEVIKLERSRLPSREIPRDAQEPSVFRCSDRSPAAGGAKGCGFEWRNVTFVFESDAWAECDFLVLELTKVSLGLRVDLTVGILFILSLFILSTSHSIFAF